MSARPWLIVTDDGRRPWHRRFAIRRLPDGRELAYWWGAFQVGVRQPYRDRLDRLIEGTSWKSKALVRRRLTQVFDKVSGCNWFKRYQEGSPHSGPCDSRGYVGIAWLPSTADRWRPDAAWPCWRHLRHAYDGPGACEEAWRWLDAQPTPRLLELVEPWCARSPKAA